MKSLRKELIKKAKRRVQEYREIPTLFEWEEDILDEIEAAFDTLKKGKQDERPSLEGAMPEVERKLHNILETANKLEEIAMDGREIIFSFEDIEDALKLIQDGVKQIEGIIDERKGDRCPNPDCPHQEAADANR